jgi:hypothetical protein
MFNVNITAQMDSPQISTKETASRVKERVYEGQVRRGQKKKRKKRETIEFSQLKDNTLLSWRSVGYVSQGTVLRPTG